LTKSFIDYDVCPYCKAINTLIVDGETGNIVCEKCGSVIGNYFTFFAEYNVIKNRREKKIEKYPAEPLKQSKPIPSIEFEINKLIPKFINEIERKYPQLTQYINEFLIWLTTEGVKMILRKAGKSWYKLSKTKSPIGKVYFRAYAIAQIRRGGIEMIKNIFAAWLHVYKNISTYKLIKEIKLCNSSGIVKWSKIIKELKKRE